MSAFKSAALFLSCFLTASAICSQTTKTIDSLEEQLQLCLDKGQFMLGCSETFYHQMDSLLNVQYRKLRTRCDSAQKENLKDEQLEWLALRDRQFRQNQQQVHQEAKESGFAGGQDEQMILKERNAQFVKDRVIELIKRTPQSYSPASYVVNPTGTYVLGEKPKKMTSDAYGYFGSIAVKSIARNKVILRLSVCKGAPSYNSGFLLDTLTVKDNRAIYQDPEVDGTCKIIFCFFRQGIRVEEFTADYNSGCGFGHAVVASGFYRRRSYKTPTSKELNEEY